MQGRYCIVAEALKRLARLHFDAKQNFIEIRLEAASSVTDMEQAVGISTDRILESASPERELDDSKTMN